MPVIAKSASTGPCRSASQARTGSKKESSSRSVASIAKRRSHRNAKSAAATWSATGTRREPEVTRSTAWRRRVVLVSRGPNPRAGSRAPDGARAREFDALGGF